MATPMTLTFGSENWLLTVPPERLVEPVRAHVVPSTVGPREMVRAALEKPYGFESLRRALTPGDHVCIVIDEKLPHLGEMVAAIIEHLLTAEIRCEDVTLLTTAPMAGSNWIDDLPDEFSDVKTEIHDPTDRKKLAYLATVAAEKRIYLNKTLVESDFAVILSGRDYDPVFGYIGAETTIFPTLSDDENLASFRDAFDATAPGEVVWPTRAQSVEVAYLLGTPFFVQAIEGQRGTICEVVAGLRDSSAEGIRRLDAHRRAKVDELPQTVIATIAESAARVTFADVAAAAACAARVVEPEGRIIVLTPTLPLNGEGVSILRAAGDPTSAERRIKKRFPDDHAAALLWAFAAKRGRIYVSGCPDADAVDELFATSITSANELQKLADAAERLLILPDAHKSMVDLI